VKVLFFISLILSALSYSAPHLTVVIPERKESILNLAEEIVGDRHSAITLMSDIDQARQSDLYICLGDAACAISKDAIKQKNIIGVFVSDQEKFAASPNFYPIYQDITFEKQLALISQVTNKGQYKVAFLENQDTFFVVNNEGYALSQIYMRNNESLSIFIKKRIRNTHPDFLVLSQKSNLTTAEISMILMLAYEFELPVIGYSKNVVANGAGATASVFLDKEIIVKMAKEAIEKYLVTNGTQEEIHKSGKAKVIFNGNLLRKYGLNKYKGETI
jgi:hypothetical protein